MATLYYFSTSHCLSSDKISFCYQNFSQNFCINHLNGCKRCYPRFSASSFKEPRTRNKVKSNEDLCNELREFSSTVGYPEDYVPSIKELSEHGRKDLAHVVRRRGYKLIRHILESSTTTKHSIKSDVEMDETRKLKLLSGSEGQNDEQKVSANDVSSSDIVEEGDLHRYQEKDNGLFSSGESSLMDSTLPFLEVKVANSMKHADATEIDDERENRTESEDAHEVQNTLSDQGDEDLIHSSSGAEALNRKFMIDYIKEEQMPINHEYDNDLDDEKLKAENLAEVNRLKLILHQKELELDQLKQQIGKEKAALSALQTNAEIEINRARKLISEKDVELHAAKESFSALKEVEIQYTGDGKIVELAGSFNGWHHRIKMDPQSSSISVGSTDNRKSELWRTVLWLYPGTYEIKFIVDGDWRIDPSMEAVRRETLQNNILRVDGDHPFAWRTSLPCTQQQRYFPDV